MPGKKRSSSKGNSDIKKPSLKSRWLWAPLYLFLAVWVLLALFSYQPDQHPANTTSPENTNLAGKLGVHVAFYFRMAAGGMAWLATLFLGWFAWIHFSKNLRSKWILFGEMVVALLAGSGLLAMQETLFASAEAYHSGPGGAIGNLLYENLMHEYVGPAGSLLIFGFAAIIAFVLIFSPATPEGYNTWLARFQDWRERRAAEKEERKEAKRLAKLEAQEEKARLKEEKQREKEQAKALAKEAKASRRSKKKLEPEVDPEPEVVEELSEEEEFVEEEAKPPLKDALKFIAAAETKKARAKLPVSQGDYTFPTLDLLTVPATPHFTNSEEEHAKNAERLKMTLQEFGVEVTMGEVHIGPVITRYEVYPAPGVRVEKISNLDKNIALGMRAHSVRILAPVPGKGCVGIEVPNQNPTPVGIREILESEDWAEAKAEIPIALGRDVSGKPIIDDLTKMPHLLIAGATGSGKTVCINSIITSLLYHASPDKLRFLMVDPKIVEMKVFNDLPHMLIPVVTDPKKVPGALKWLLNEMEHRYEMFSKVGVRNIAGFNARKKKEKEKSEAEKNEEQSELEISVPRDEGVFDEIPEKIPYIVCIIDELADLMMVNPAEVETGVARLAQLARASGIHLVIATQRPSVNVITGIIKANLPSRIAFQVASKIDSRTILDGMGAEQLIGRGDMLFSSAGSSKPVRTQGAFVSDEEIRDIVEFLKTNGPPEFAEDVQKQIDAPDELTLDSGDEDGDEMLPQAIQVLRSTKRASTSMLQRRLRIGYNRAARIMEILEDRGIVGPENGSSPREILVDLDGV